MALRSMLAGLEWHNATPADPAVCPAPAPRVWLPAACPFGCPQEHKQVVADALDLVEFKAGEAVFAQGEAGDKFYCIKEGTGGRTWVGWKGRKEERKGRKGGKGRKKERTS